MDASEERRKLYNGFGETFSRAIEFVATPFLFGLFGLFLDGRLGTGRVFTVLLAALALVGMFLRFWYRYVEDMKSEEATAPWRQR